MSELRHECCPQARTVLEHAHARLGAGAWRMRIPVADDARLCALVSVIYCPWCGVELETWRGKRRPALHVVKSSGKGPTR